MFKVGPCFLFCCVQGEYEIVANDYDKAKTLFANTKVSVFKRGKLCVCERGRE